MDSKIGIKHGSQKKECPYGIRRISFKFEIIYHLKSSPAKQKEQIDNG